jgi:small-conductance mechanosensitive channel
MNRGSWRRVLVVVLPLALLSTRVRTIKNVDVTIPNSMILASLIVNYSSSAAEYGLIRNTAVTIGYGTEWRKVHELLISAARRTEGILEPPAFRVAPVPENPRKDG